MASFRREFTSELAHLGAIRAAVGDACRHAWGAGEPEEDAIGLLVLAVDEAATNVIIHAYGREPGRPIELAVEADAEQASVCLYHEGKDFDPHAVPPPAFDGTRQGGFGVYLIRRCVNDVRYERDESGRRVVRLVKRRDHRPEGE